MMLKNLKKRVRTSTKRNAKQEWKEPIRQDRNVTEIVQLRTEIPFVFSIG